MEGMLCKFGVSMSDLETKNNMNDNQDIKEPR